MAIHRALAEKYLMDDAAFWDQAEFAEATLNRYGVDDAFIGKFVYELISQKDIGRAMAIHESAGRIARVFCPETEPMLPAVLLARCLPGALNTFAALGVSDEIARDTLMDFGIWAREYERQSGKKGVSETPWIFLPYTGRIFRLGRLQYEMTRFHLNMFVLSRVSDGATAAIHAEGAFYDPDANVLTGVATDLATAAPTTRECFDLNEWTQVLRPGSHVLDIHVPAETPLDPAEVQVSLARARVFFKGLGYDAAYAECESWLLDTHLTNLLAEDSNTVIFMRMFMKLSAEHGHSDIARRVFGFKFDMANLPSYEPKTRMQRALKDYLAAGGKTEDMIGILPLP